MSLHIRHSFLAIMAVVCVMSPSCKDDPGDPVPYSELIAFDIMEGYYYEIPGQMDDWHYYLTDRRGRIIADTTPVNGRINRMYGSFDPDQPFDLTIVHRAFYFDKMNYSIQTIMDIKPGTYRLVRPMAIPPANAEFTITNLDKNLTDFSATSYELEYSAAESKALLKLQLRDLPGNVYSSFRKEGESETRFLYRKDVDNTTCDTIDYSALPIMTGSSTITFPTNSWLETSVYGVDNDFPSRFFFIDRDKDTSGKNTAAFQTPESIFDRYQFSSRFTIGENKYDVDRIEPAIPSQIAIPDLQFTILNEHPDQFSMTSPSTYTSYHVVFGSSNENADFRVLWSVGGIGSSTVAFDLPAIQQMFLPEHNFADAEIKRTLTQIRHIADFDDAEEIQYQLCMWAIPESQVTRLESVTRY